MLAPRCERRLVAEGSDWARVEIELGPGEKRVIEIDGREVLIGRMADRYFAAAPRCPHAAWPLADEPVEGFEIVCTLHGARFDLRDGCPTSGPARRPLAIYPIELRDGGLFVSLPR